MEGREGRRERKKISGFILHNLLLMGELQTGVALGWGGRCLNV